MTHKASLPPPVLPQRIQPGAAHYLDFRVARLPVGAGLGEHPGG
ncbi:hypothetical protein [Deinococcus sp.]|nr:hypothetical protein [Deinococcus sp.]